MNSKILSLVLVFALTDIILSQPDLCRNPKVDSITWIDNKKMWFFTSGGYLWNLKEEDFPPTADNVFNGQLPEGFEKGQASAYRDWLKVCKKSKSVSKPGEQLVFMVEKINDQNVIIEFDTREQKFVNESHAWDEDRIIGRARLENGLSGDIEAMFTFRDSEIYVVEGNYYAGVNWKNLCNKPDDYADVYTRQGRDGLQNSKKRFDAIAVKGSKMYQFVGNQYWNFTLDEQKSKDGKLFGAQSSSNQLKKFFRFPDECPTPKPTTSKPGGDSNDSDNKDPGGGGGDEQPQNDIPGDPPVKGNESKSWLWIIVIVIIVIIIVLVVIAFFLLRKKSVPAAKPEAGKANTYKAKGLGTPKAGRAGTQKK